MYVTRLQRCGQLRAKLISVQLFPLCCEVVQCSTTGRLTISGMMKNSMRVQCPNDSGADHSQATLVNFNTNLCYNCTQRDDAEPFVKIFGSEVIRCTESGEWSDNVLVCDSEWPRTIARY